jgi:kynureninase
MWRRLAREKSLRQTALSAELVAQHCAEWGLRPASPSDPVRRGSQVCFAHAHAYPIMQALIARGVIGDFRAPDILRFGITPLYLGFAELWDAAHGVGERRVAGGALSDPAEGHVAAHARRKRSTRERLVISRTSSPVKHRQTR